jgi:hypothetical protein
MTGRPRSSVGVEDDAELHGILEAVAALGLSLVSVIPVAPERLSRVDR